MSLRIIICGLLLSMGVAFADENGESPSATGDVPLTVEVEVGLSMTCTALNFGQIIVPIGNRAGTNTVTVLTNGEIQRDGVGSVAFGGNHEPGQCAVTGMSEEETILLASAANSGVVALSRRTSGVGTVQVAWPGSTSNGMAVTLFLDDNNRSGWGSSAVEVYRGTDSTTQFKIGGELFLKDDNFVLANMGVYESTITITVAESDVD